MGFKVESSQAKKLATNTTFTFSKINPLMESLGNIEFQADLDPYLSKGRAQYSTLRDDPDKFHIVMPDPAAHEDDIYALEHRSPLFGMYAHDTERMEDALPRWALDTDDPKTWYDYDSNPNPHLGSARAGLLKGQYSEEGHVYIFPSAYSDKFFAEKGGNRPTDAFGKDLGPIDPNDVWRHEVSHDVSLRFNNILKQLGDEVPFLSGTMREKFIERIGGHENFALYEWFQGRDGEELITRYEDFLLGSPADKAMAEKMVNGTIKYAMDSHKDAIDTVHGLSTQGVPMMEIYFTDEQLEILNKYHEGYMSQWSRAVQGTMGDDEYITLDPASLLEGTSGGNWDQDTVDGYLDARKRLSDAQGQAKVAKDYIKIIKLIPDIYDAQMKALEEHRQAGGVLDGEVTR